MQLWGALRTALGTIWAMISKKPAKLNKQFRSSTLFMDTVVGIMREHAYLPTDGSPASQDNAQLHYNEAIWQGELHEQSDVQAQMSLLASIQDLSLAVEDAGRRLRHSSCSYALRWKPLHRRTS